MGDEEREMRALLRREKALDRVLPWVAGGEHEMRATNGTDSGTPERDGPHLYGSARLTVLGVDYRVDVSVRQRKGETDRQLRKRWAAEALRQIAEAVEGV